MVFRPEYQAMRLYRGAAHAMRAHGLSVLVTCTRPMPVTNTSFSTWDAPPSTVPTAPLSA